MTVELAVLGASVSGSLSPFLHESAALALGHGIRYGARSCRDEAAFLIEVRAFQQRSARGVNVTAPFKRCAYVLSDERGLEAEEIGAVNTLCFETSGQIRGDNTDGPGLLSLLTRVPAEVLGRASVLGAGGVARAALWALSRHGVSDVRLFARDPERASAVASFGARVDDFEGGPVEAGLVISALPPDRIATDRALAALPRARSNTVLLDLAYGGLGFETDLVVEARARGYTSFDGRSLLVAQAAHAYHLFVGGELSVIEQAMRDALKGRDSLSPLL